MAFTGFLLLLFFRSPKICPTDKVLWVSGPWDCKHVWEAKIYVPASDDAASPWDWDRRCGSIMKLAICAYLGHITIFAKCYQTGFWDLFFHCHERGVWLPCIVLGMSFLFGELFLSLRIKNFFVNSFVKISWHFWVSLHLYWKTISTECETEKGQILHCQPTYLPFMFFLP